MSTTTQSSTPTTSDVPIDDFEHLDKHLPIKRQSLRMQNSTYLHHKDSCPVFDGHKWHMFGTADRKRKGGWVEILHAIADNSDGEWVIQEQVKIHGVNGARICAPGVVFDHNLQTFYMFVHADWLSDDTARVECLKSTDGGNNFYYVNTIITAESNVDEYRIYDPHPTEVNGEKYIVYTVADKDIVHRFCLAKSKNNTWESEWEKLGTILTESEVQFQCPAGMLGREWGLEGAQIIQLPNGIIVLNAVCFLPETDRTRPGQKQRFFLAVAKEITGPYKILGPMIKPTSRGWESGENGHATGIVEGNNLKMFYHARKKSGYHPSWHYGVASCDIDSFTQFVNQKI